MTRFYKAQVMLGNKPKVVVMLNHADQQQTKKLSVSVQHNIILIDQSLSMTHEINLLIDQVEKSFEYMDPKDYVSVIGFSSHDWCKVYIRGARKDDDIKKLLDQMRRTISQTCFSVPLKKAEEIVDDLAALCPNFAVTLFTDGNPVTPWSESEEESRILRTLDSLGNKVIAVNTIGYGYYYNQDLLLAIANKTEYGTFVHSRDIKDYSKIFSHNYERVSELSAGSIEVEAEGAEILYLTDRNTKLTKDVLRLRMMSRNKNQLFIIADDELTFKYNGEVYDSRKLDARKIRVDTLRNMYYAYAYNAYYLGMRHASLDVIVKNVGDKALADSHLRSFTYDEVSRHTEKLQKAVFNLKARYTLGTCDEDYIPKDDQACVIDILNILASNRGNYYMPLPYSEYNRIGRQTIDTHSILLDTQIDDGRSPFSDLVFHKTRLNVSVRHVIRRIAQLNPRAAARVGLPDKMQVELVRHQTIVKDGNLNVPRVEALVTDETMQSLRDREVEFRVKRTRDADGMTHIVIPLEDVPIINRTYITKDTSYVLRTVHSLVLLEAEQKVLRHFLRQVRGNSEYRKGEFKKFTAEQIEVLRDHGIDHNLNYVGIKNETLEATDFYETRFLELQIKGATNLPSVDDVMERKARGAKLNAVQAYMAGFIDKILSAAREKGFDIDSAQAGNFLREKLNEVRKEILAKRMELASLKIAKVVTGDWFNDVQPDGKGNYTFTEGDVTLVIKPGREKIYI